MGRGFLSNGRWLIAAQLGAAGAILALPAMPATRGDYLLVPVFGSAGDAVRIARDAGLPLLGRGRLPGSIVVRGGRDMLAAPLLGHGILILGTTASPACDPDPA